MGEILRMEGISKSFPGVKALDNVNIVINSEKSMRFWGKMAQGNPH